MNTVNEPVTGTLTGFRLVLGSKTLAFDTFAEMSAKAEGLQDGAFHKAIKREDNGEIELSLGASASEEVEDQYIKLFCKCGKGEWLPRRADMSLDFECSSCDGTFDHGAGESKQYDAEF